MGSKSRGYTATLAWGREIEYSRLLKMRNLSLSRFLASANSSGNSLCWAYLTSGSFSPCVSDGRKVRPVFSSSNVTHPSLATNTATSCSVIHDNMSAQMFFLPC